MLNRSGPGQYHVCYVIFISHLQGDHTCKMNKLPVLVQKLYIWALPEAYLTNNVYMIYLIYSSAYYETVGLEIVSHNELGLC